MQDWGLFTRAVQAGERPAPKAFRSTTTPVYLSSSFYYDDPELLDHAFAHPDEGYVYSRYGNPTVTAFEQAIAALEGTETAIAYASGMGALHGALLAAGLGPGHTVLASQDIYGATYALLRTLLQRFGVRVIFADFTQTQAVLDLLQSVRPQVILFETISNPLIRVADAPAILAAARQVDAISIVDNTFATPLLCQPAAWGADLVVHSSTKYIGGHGDLTSGVICGSAEWRNRLLEINKMVGSVAAPVDSWLALRGIKTLPLRVARQNESAVELASWLSQHPRVEGVYHPALANHPQHELAQQLFPRGRYGAMISFDLKLATREAAFTFMRSLRMIVPATTLGDVYSLVLYPAHSSHRALTAEERAGIGIGDGLMRLSVGLEDIEDIQADLNQALAKACP